MACGVQLSCGEVLAQLLVIGLTNGAIIALNAISVTLIYYLSPNLAEFRISALVLIMVVLGGARRVVGPIVGAVLIASYDLIIISRVGDWFDQLRESTGSWFWSAVNPRGSNFLAFGLLLYLSVLYRSRRMAR